MESGRIGGIPSAKGALSVLIPRPQLRNAHRIGSRIIEQSGVYRGRPTWIANVNDLDSVIPAEVCELDGGDGETV